MVFFKPGNSLANFNGADYGLVRNLSFDFEKVLHDVDRHMHALSHTTLFLYCIFIILQYLCIIKITQYEVQKVSPHFTVGENIEKHQ